MVQTPMTVGTEGPGAPSKDPDRRHPLRHGRSACFGRTGRSATATTRPCGPAARSTCHG
ncbi:MAG: hypothetical protein MZV64_43710 [Ignavibacteriales bacterium]|nr:hypothetical protein [Ignavibacteriales bacterium]